MTDTERVYALYVQANPVPDPEALPLTQTKTSLLTHERSTAMDTQDRIEVLPSRPVKRRRAFGFGFTAVAVIAAATAAVVLLVTGDDDRPVAAADAAPRVVFDGNSCRYEGPTLIERGIIEFTWVNATSERFAVAGWRMVDPKLTAELDRFPLGADTAELSPMPAGLLAINAEVEAGSESVAQRDLIVGSYLIDCLSYDAGVTNHVWRAQSAVEIVAP